MKRLKSFFSIAALVFAFALPNIATAGTHEGTKANTDTVSPTGKTASKTTAEKDNYIYDYGYYDVYDYGYDGLDSDDDWFYDFYSYGDTFSSPEYELDYDWVENSYEWEEDDLFFDDDIE